MSVNRKLSVGFAILGFLFLAVIIVRHLLTDNKHIKEETFEGVVFSQEDAARLLDVMLVKERDDEAYWMPEETQILMLEKQLDSQVQAQLPALASQLTTYKRQYFGFVRDERALIWIVGFCDTGDVDWQNDLVSFSDTPGCYFEAQYDVDNDTLLYVWELAEE